MTQAKSIVAQNAAQIAGVIDIHHGKPMVSSLRIAEIFDRQHKNVLRVLRTLDGPTCENLVAQIEGVVPSRGRGKNLEISAGVIAGKVSWDTYEDERGKTWPVAWIAEREALIAMPFFGGRKAMEGQRKLVDAYLYYRGHFNNPPRSDILKDKRAAHNPMMDALIEFRTDQGKDTDERHFQCENKLCNWVVTGEFKAIDEKAMSNEEAAILAKVRKRNEAYILAGLDYATRKPKLAEFAIRHRTKLIETQQ